MRWLPSTPGRPSWVSWLASTRRAMTISRFCGVVVLKGVLPAALTEEVRRWAADAGRLEPLRRPPLETVES